MNTITESTHRITGQLETTTTVYYEIKDGVKEQVKKIVVKHWVDSQYVQTHIYDEWGYKTLWFDNHGKYQHFARVVKTEGTPSEIGKIDGETWLVTDTDADIFKGKLYSPKDYQGLRRRFFCEPHPQHFIKEIVRKDIPVKSKKMKFDVKVITKDKS